MSDLIERQAAIEAMRKCQTYRFSATEPRMIMLAAAEEVIEELPSAQPDRELIEQLKWERDTAIQQLRDLGYGLGEKPKTDDTISRQAAIDVADKFSDADGCNGSDVAIDIISGLISLPSAPPKKVCVAEVKVELDDIKDYIDKAINAERWIPCSEKLPETNGRYIVTRGLKACNSIWNRVYIINYSDLMGLKAEKIWWDGNVGKSDFQKIDDVIAWMPLPEVYKGEQG